MQWIENDFNQVNQSSDLRAPPMSARGQASGKSIHPERYSDPKERILLLEIIECVYRCTCVSHNPKKLNLLSNPQRPGTLRRCTVLTEPEYLHIT